MSDMSSIASEIVVLYGSETGTAEDVAYRIYNTLSSTADVSIFSLDDYDVANLPREKLALFVVSTTGDGDVPSSMKAFWTFLLRKSLVSNSLANLHVAVFGLGDSSYEKFNAAARRLNKRLQQLGATEVLPIGLGDDQDRYSYLTKLDTWLPSFYTALKKLNYLPASLSDTNISVHSDVAYEITVLPNIETYSIAHTLQNFRQPDRCKGPLKRPFFAVVKENKRITASSWSQNVRHISLDCSSMIDSVSESISPTAAGDIATVHPRNVNSLVSRAITVLAEINCDGVAYALDTIVSIATRRSQLRRRAIRDCICTIKELLSGLLDLAGSPQRSFFLALSSAATNDEERDKLLELGSAAGTDLYFEYCVKEKRGYIDVLEDFRSARPSLSLLLELIPVLQPRHYSIASSGRVDPTQIELCVAVVENRTPYGRLRTGCCSGYLASLAVGDSVMLWIREGAFRAPPLEVPLILVGPGTGIAPMRALVQERLTLSSILAPKLIIPDRASQSTQAKEPMEARTHESLVACAGTTDDASPEVAPCLVFFGCRKRSADYLYEDEWPKYCCIGPSSSTCHSQDMLMENDNTINESSTSSSSLSSSSSSRSLPQLAESFSVDVDSIAGCLVNFAGAFSQDQAHKVYVTHKLRLHGKAVVEALDKGGAVFISGSAKRMPADVRAAIREVLVTYGRAATDVQAEATIKSMEKAGRYIVEAWS